MGSKKMIPFYILNILKENTDEEHGLLLSEIIRAINDIYGEDTVAVDKTQTIKKNIAEINDFYFNSYDGEIIQSFDDKKNKNYKRYFLSMREFDLGEIAFFYDYLVNTNSLPQEEIETLSKKLLSYLSAEQRKKIIGKNLTDGSTKTDNREIYINLESIDKAISNKQNIQFDYYEYNLNKKLVKRVRDYSYVVSPYKTISSGGKYYIIGYHLPTESLRTFRVDKIKKIDKNKEYDYHKIDALNIEAYTKNSPYMHTDNDKITVKLRCENSILDDVIERFAECRLSIEETRPGHFTAIIPRTTYLGMKYWILGFTSACEVLEPNELREDVRATLHRALRWYEK